MVSRTLDTKRGHYKRQEKRRPGANKKRKIYPKDDARNRKEDGLLCSDRNFGKRSLKIMNSFDV
uniref:Uncharacterized protein n=1 Tax=Romanomermis culicivorax TaxID=13658 RepID=A0A915KDB8_ROMCU